MSANMETPATPATETPEPLPSGAVWKTIVFVTALPFVLLVILFVIMASLNFNILNWME